MTFSLGIDIGGTKIAGALVNNKGESYYRIELPSTPNDREKMFQQVISVITSVLKQVNYKIEDIKGIGIGLPGKVDQENGIAVSQNNLPWNNFPIIERLKQHFSTNFYLDNDVYMAAYGEWCLLGKNQKETFVYKTISTGISCCTIHNGEIIRGAGFAGEIGLSIVTESFLESKYKNNGCLEAMASGSAIQRIANEKMKPTGGMKDANLTESYTTKDVIELYRMNDPISVEVMNEVFKHLATGIHTITCLLDPHTLVLGGGVINNHPDIQGFIKKELEKVLTLEQIGILGRIYPSTLKGDAGLIGAGLRIHSLDIGTQGSCVLT
jgi:glucokinase